MTRNDVIIRALKRTCGAKFRSYLAYKELCASWAKGESNLTLDELLTLNPVRV